MVATVEVFESETAVTLFLFVNISITVVFVMTGYVASVSIPAVFFSFGLF